MKKLVRDKIPDILTKKSRDHKTETLIDDQQYLLALHKKLIEEVDEFIEASNNQDDEKTKEELADVLEVIDALCQLKNYNSDEIEALRQKKKSERGGFSKRILLSVG